MNKSINITNTISGDIMKENKNVLDELNKGCSMGTYAISCLYDKVQDKEFKESLKLQHNKYKDMAKNISKLYDKYDSSKEPHDLNSMSKTMTYYGIEMRTAFDDSDSKIAELLLQGTNMGIIEGRRILNNKTLDKEVEKLAKEYVTMQEDSVENLKKYL